MAHGTGFESQLSNIFYRVLLYNNVMSILLTEDEVKKHKQYDKIPIKCDYCHGTSFRIKKNLNSFRYPKRNIAIKDCPVFCNSICASNSLKTALEVQCKQCKISFHKLLCNIKKIPNHFCSKSCAASYNNTHKTYGIRRSKLEVYLEEQIRLNYPSLNLICNSKEAVNSELDFYFLSLKFAIELNGILHYEPIYGQDKFDKIQNNDKQKSQLCFQKGIELAIIDSSTCDYLNQKAKDKYWNIVNNLIIQVKDRFKDSLD